MSKLTISIESWNRGCSGMNVDLYYDPEDHEVYVFANVGSGMPMKAFNHIHRHVKSIPIDTVPDALEGWCREQDTTTWVGGTRKLITSWRRCGRTSSARS